MDAAQITALVKQLLKELQIAQETVHFRSSAALEAAINSSDNYHKKPNSQRTFAGPLSP